MRAWLQCAGRFMTALGRLHHKAGLRRRPHRGQSHGLWPGAGGGRLLGVVHRLHGRDGATLADVEGLAVASSVATLAIAPFAVATAGHRLLDPRLLAFGALVGLLSSVIPYSLEMAALRTLPPRVFGILMSLEPAAAALAAAVVLGEWLSPLQLLAMACVTAASVGATRAGSTPAAVPPDSSHPDPPGSAA